MAGQREHPLISTILVRTLMDGRYFHGIRTAAALILNKHAKDEVGWVGFFHLQKAFQEMFCYSNSTMAKSNNFSDRASYYIQCIIPQAMAKIRDNNGRTPLFVRKFLYELLRYNDNSNNNVSFTNSRLNVQMLTPQSTPIATISLRLWALWLKQCHQHHHLAAKP